MINDRPVSSTAVAAALFWASSIALIVYSIVTHRYGWGQLGVLLGCFGCILHVRKMLAAMASRERAAFNLGRQSGPRAVPAEDWAGR